MALPRIIKRPFRQVKGGDVELGSLLSRWFETRLGESFVIAQRQVLNQILPSLFGYHALQCSIGKPVDLLTESRIKHKIIITEPRLESELGDALPENVLTAKAASLPFANDCMDVVVLHHSLDFGTDPHQVLREAYRTLIPGGKLVIVGFNPWSLWGLFRIVNLVLKKLPGFARYLSPHRVIDWLHVLNFEVSGCESAYYLPPLDPANKLCSKISWLDSLGSRWWSQRGGFYVLLAEKRMSLITPIKPRKRFSAPSGGLVVLPAARKTDDKG